METLQQLEQGRLLGAKALKISSVGLQEIPGLVCSLADSLEQLDLSDNYLSELPFWFRDMRKLRILFLSNNQFRRFPSVLKELEALQIVAFRNNGMQELPEDSLPRNIRWLILTDNLIERLPADIGQRQALEKLMLTGNRLTTLPQALQRLQNLVLLRLSANSLSTLPTWLIQLPRLSYLAFAGNPCSFQKRIYDPSSQIPEVGSHDLEIQHLLGSGASGHIYQATQRVSVDLPTVFALKVFKGTITSDGRPVDELHACLRAGKHPNIVSTLLTVLYNNQVAVGFELIPKEFTVLGSPPSLSSCTRDQFFSVLPYDMRGCIKILLGVAEAMSHLHSHGILHGDLYAHNILVNKAGQAILSDLGAATLYQASMNDNAQLQQLEVQAFGRLVQDLLENADISSLDFRFYDIREIASSCRLEDITKRPMFSDLCRDLRACADLVI